MAIGTVAVDRWAATFGTAMRSPRLGGAPSPPSPLIAVPNVTAHPVNGQYTNFIIRCGIIIAFAL